MKHPPLAKPTTLLLNAIETWERILGQSGIRRYLWNRITRDKIKENALPSLDHLVKHNGKFDKTYKALKDTFDDDEDSDDMIGNMPVYNEKEATNSIENDQNTVGSDHEVTGRNERIDNVTESAFSVRDGIQIYLMTL